MDATHNNCNKNSTGWRAIFIGEQLNWCILSVAFWNDL